LSGNPVVLHERARRDIDEAVGHYLAEAGAASFGFLWIAATSTTSGTRVPAGSVSPLAIARDDEDAAMNRRIGFSSATARDPHRRLRRRGQAPRGFPPSRDDRGCPVSPLNVDGDKIGRGLMFNPDTRFRT